MTYQYARKVGKNNLMFMPIFPVCTPNTIYIQKTFKKVAWSFAKNWESGKRYK